MMTELSGARQAKLIETANSLMNARRQNSPFSDLPLELQPTMLDEAYFVQDTMAASIGDIGGWKVGAPTADGVPIFAPMPVNWIAENGSILRGPTHRFRGLEAEIAFLLASDLPPRSTPYTREEVIATIASCHPAIEVLESALLDPNAAIRMSMLADMQMHGGFIFGPAYADWKSIDFKQESVVLSVDGIVRVERTGSNTAGDLMRLLPWLANDGAARTGGLKAGQWITTGSWTGCTVAEAGSSVDVHFSNLGRVALRFE
jgi:2-keto-4-pentenoate hydratase